MSANDAQMQQFLEVRHRRSHSRAHRRVRLVLARHRRAPNCIFLARWRSQEEKRKAVFNEVVAKLTEKCFDKCVTYAPGNKFSSSESSCLSNCALVYLQSGQVVLERLQNMGQR
jgi:import inner membrane translocase subunit TIM8